MKGFSPKVGRIPRDTIRRVRSLKGKNVLTQQSRPNSIPNIMQQMRLICFNFREPKNYEDL